MLPSLVEYLMSLRSSGGTMLCKPATTQAIVALNPPAAPPSYQVWPIVPPVGDYACIGYRTLFGLDMVANTCTAVVEQEGAGIFTGVLSTSVLDKGVDYFIAFDSKRPQRIRIENISAVMQRAEFH